MLQAGAGDPAAARGAALALGALPSAALLGDAPLVLDAIVNAAQVLRTVQGAQHGVSQDGCCVLHLVWTSGGVDKKKGTKREQYQNKLTTPTVDT